jgi:hypothetical protein
MIGRMMEKLSDPVPEFARERSSEEIYLASIPNDINNVKIRDGSIDIKRLLKKQANLEQWEPVFKSGFPVAKEILINEVYPALMIDVADIQKSIFSLEEFMELSGNQNGLYSARVIKKRFGYMIDGTICEYCNVVIEGVPLDTVAIESVDPVDILKTITKTGLEDIININYLEAVKRVLGIIDKPFAFS